jgi:cytosine/uracil/thiamine/allantoin permease
LSWLFGIGVSGAVYLALSRRVTSAASVAASGAGS